MRTFHSMSVALALIILGGGVAADAPFVVESWAPVARLRIATDQAIGAEHRDHDDAVVHGRLRGAMVHSAGSVMPVGEAFAAFGDAIGVRVTLAFAEDPHDAGSPLDRPVMIDATAEPVRAIALLGDLVDSTFGERGAWQVLGGRLEIGPKEFLGRRESRRREFLEFEFLHDRHPGVADQPADTTQARETPEVRATRMIAHLASLEPDAFEPHDAIRARLERTDEITNPLARVGHQASISWRQGFLLVTAPEYVLHAIRGPRGVEPPDPDSTPPRNVALRGERGVASAQLLRHEPRRRGGRGRASGPGLSGGWGGVGPADPGLVALGRLWHARLRVAFDGVAVRDAVQAIADATGIEIRGHWSSDDDRPGIDPDARITLLGDELGGVEALEMILSMAEASSPATWQLHLGSIEIGPRTVLARRSARRTVTYDSADLMLEPTYSVPRGLFAHQLNLHPRNDNWLDVVTPLEERWGDELGFQRNLRGARYDPVTRFAEFNPRVVAERRKTGDFLAAELLLDIERHIETEAWLPRDDEPVMDRRRTLERHVLGRRGIWATASHRNGRLILDAPDFIHRGIGGYPPLPSPAGER